MNEKSLSRWRIVTLITTTVAFLFAVTYALTGYIVFGQKTEGIVNKIFTSTISAFFYEINQR
jgi:membrane protein YdbS with pleckstrin-like domain